MIDLALPSGQFFTRAPFVWEAPQRSALRLLADRLRAFVVYPLSPCTSSSSPRSRSSVTFTSGILAAVPTHRVHQPVGGLGPNVCLHPEVPLFAFLGRTNLWIAFALAVFRRRRRRHQCRIHHRPMAQDQATFTEQGIDLIEHRRGQPVAFEQMAKLEDCGLVGHTFDGGIQTGKAAQQRKIEPFKRNNSIENGWGVR